MTTTTYPPANRTASWFAGRYSGDLIKPNCGVLHTTEGTGWPSYSGGASAPQITARPNMAKRRLEWRQHFPLNRSGRALVNRAGGVETNTMNVIQVELVGTCDPRHARSWNGARAGEDYIYWPHAPQWALEDLADFLVWCHRTYRIRLDGPEEWLPYPSSYGATRARMSFGEWNRFYGWCGHQHVPENTHGDPGNLPFRKVVGIAKAKLDGDYAKPSRPAPKPPTTKRVVVWAGATLTAIALAAGVGLPALEKANPQIKDPDRIRPGQTVILPPGSKQVTPPKTAPKPKPKPKPPAAPAFPGRDKFGPGKNNAHVTRLGRQLVKKGYGRHYRVGPGPRWSEADRRNVAAFQHAHRALAGDPDGLPGPLTWKILFS